MPEPLRKRLDGNLLDSWAILLRKDPNAVAIIEAGSETKCRRGELEGAAQAWRARLPAEARLHGMRVAMVESNGIGWFQVLLGLLSAGAIPAPLDPGEPAEAQRTAARALGAGWIWREGCLSRIERPKKTARSDQRDVCLIKVTSGSSGTPKAFPFTHAQMAADGRQICATMKIAPDDLNLGVVPFGHSYGLGNLVLPLLTQGTAVVCAASPLPQSLAADCLRWRPTLFPAVPPLLLALAQSSLEASALASLRLVISAGSALPPETAASFYLRFGRRVHGFYGSSETGGICFDPTGEATLEGRSVGRPLVGVSLEFPKGSASGRRFVVSSAAVMGDGRHRPGDFGRLDERGELILLGRADRLVKLGARRVDLGEIESALRAIPGVRQAWAAPHPSKAGALAAAVATDLDAAEVRRRMRERTAPWKIPNRIVPLPQFPVTGRGKVDTRQLRKLIGAPG